MIRTQSRRLLLAAALVISGSSGLALAQSPPPLDEFETEAPDLQAAIRDGFEIVEVSEHKSDARTSTIRERFIVPIERSVGQDGSHDFEWALVDLNGDGYSDVVLVPRAPGLGLEDRYEGIRMMVFTFDGKEWRKTLDGGGQAVARRVSRGKDGVERHEVALLQAKERFLFRWDGGKFAEVTE